MVSIMEKTPIEIAIDLVGAPKIAAACKVSAQAVYKWQAKRRLPRTEWTGETDYASSIAALCSNRVTRDELLNLSARAAA